MGGLPYLVGNEPEGLPGLVVPIIRPVAPKDEDEGQDRTHECVESLGVGSDGPPPCLFDVEELDEDVEEDAHDELGEDCGVGRWVGGWVGLVTLNRDG